MADVAGFQPQVVAEGKGDDSERGRRDSQDSLAIDKRALRLALLRTDLCLLPAVTFIYFLNFLDRSNIGNAKAAGLQTDLKLTSHQYSIALTVTYVPYIVAELPLTLLMKRVGPNRMLPATVVAWGLVTTFQGFVTSYGGLIACRFFIGLSEGAILPGSITYLSTFYRRADLGKRVAVFYSATSLAGAFSGLLAAAIINMDGLSGKRGWQWIFFLEGIFTVLFGFAAFFLLPRSIETARFLSPAQRAALAGAHEAETLSSVGKERFSRDALTRALTSLQVWLIFAAFFCNGAGLYALAYFAPTIVQGLGYKGVSIQLHSVPPYACSAVFAIAICIASDRARHRGAFVIFAALIAIVGYALYLSSSQHSHAYASLFLQTIGQYSLAPLLSVWMPNNLQSYFTRTTGIAVGFIATNSGGILSTWLFPSTQAPRYHQATSILLGLTCAIIPLAAINSSYLAWRNRREARGSQTDGETNGAFRFIT